MVEHEFIDSTIIITGGTAGIGETVAYRFLEEGANVVVCGRDAEKGKNVTNKANERLKVKNQKRATSGKNELTNEIMFVETDVTNENSVKAMISSAIEKFSYINLAFNNAGWGGGISPMHTCDADNWKRVIDLNLTAPFYCLKHQVTQFLHQMEKQNMTERQYSIVNMSSVYGLRGTHLGLTPYVSSKHGIIGLTSAAALEYADKGIRINSVCPGWIETESNQAARSIPEVLAEVIKDHPMNRIGSTDEVADSVLFLCSKASRFITGHNLTIDGGKTAK